MCGFFDAAGLMFICVYLVGGFQAFLRSGAFQAPQPNSGVCKVRDSHPLAGQTTADQENHSWSETPHEGGKWGRFVTVIAPPRGCLPRVNRD
jgi:hypothetical protein